VSPPVSPSADGQAGGDGVGDHAVTDTGPVDRATPRSRAGMILAVVAVVLVVVLGVVALVAGEASPPADAGATPVTTGGAAAPRGPVVGPTAPTTTPAPVTGRSPAIDPVGDRPPDGPPEVVDPAGPSAPEPLVHPFAQLPGASAEPKRSGPPASLPRQIEADGCDRHYGEVTQCIPLAFPPGVTDRCGWLQARGYGPLGVHGEDRQHLDTDADGIACGPGE
jgi:hypothetical protein